MKNKSVKNMERFIELHELLDYATWRIKMDIKGKEILLTPSIFGHNSRTKFRNELKALNSMKIPFKKSLEFSKFHLEQLLCSKTHGEENLNIFKEEIFGKIDSYCIDRQWVKGGMKVLDCKKIDLEFLEGIIFEWKEQKRFNALTLKILNTGKIPKHRPFKTEVKKRGVELYQARNIHSLNKEDFNKYFTVYDRSRFYLDTPDFCKTFKTVSDLENLGFRINKNCNTYKKLIELSVFNDLGDDKIA